MHDQQANRESHSNAAPEEGAPRARTPGATVVGDLEGRPRKAAGSPPHGKKRRPLLILAAVILTVGAVGIIYYLHARNFVKTDDAFVDAHVVQISPRVAATVAAVHFSDNQEVKQGDILIELDPRDFNVALEKAQAQLRQAEAQVAQAEALVEQSTAQAAQARAQFTQQQAQSEVAGINFERSASLYQRDLRAVSKQEVDSTKASRDAAAAASSAAKANIQAVESVGEGSRAQVIAAKAAFGAAESAVHDAQLQLSYTKIAAVADGRMARKQVEPGDYAQPSQTLCSLVMHEVWVTANYKETELRRMRIGQPVDVEVDAYPDRVLRAHVESIQPGTGGRFTLLPPENATGNFVKVVQRVPVKIVFDEPLSALRELGPGMSVVPKVKLNAPVRSRRESRDAPAP